MRGTSEEKHTCFLTATPSYLGTAADYRALPLGLCLQLDGNVVAQCKNGCVLVLPGHSHCHHVLCHSAFPRRLLGSPKGESLSLFYVTESGWGGVSSLCFQAQSPSPPLTPSLPVHPLCDSLTLPCRFPHCFNLAGRQRAQSSFGEQT